MPIGRIDSVYESTISLELNINLDYRVSINSAILIDINKDQLAAFTLTGTGTYGWYDLGPNAYADMTTMAATFGTYQLVLVFDNEPSTNWKRFSATQCNLRVTYQNPQCTILPIELADFQVNCDNGQAAIEWSTISESSNDYFTISKSTDGVQFTDLTTVVGAGYSSEPQHYSYTDDARQSGLVYYRLSQTDLDGATEYFTPEVFQGCDLEVPLIVTEQGKFVRVVGNSIQEVQLLDLMGRKIHCEINTSNTPSLIINKQVNSGMYLIRVIYDSNKILTQQVYLGR